MTIVARMWSHFMTNSCLYNWQLNLHVRKSRAVLCLSLYPVSNSTINYNEWEESIWNYSLFINSIHKKIHSFVKHTHPMSTHNYSVHASVCVRRNWKINTGKQMGCNSKYDNKFSAANFNPPQVGRSSRKIYKAIRSLFLKKMSKSKNNA